MTEFSSRASMLAQAVGNERRNGIDVLPDSGFSFRLNEQGYRNNNGLRDNVASFVSQYMDKHKDPASDIKGMPPLFGQDVLPHAMTFQSLIGSYAKTYLPADEALEANPNDAAQMLKNVGIRECLQIRQFMVALTGWSIQPENSKSPAQKSLAAMLTKCLQRIRRFTEYRRCMQAAIWSGKSAIQHRYGNEVIDGQALKIPKPLHQDDLGWKHIHGDKIVFRYDDGREFPPGAFPDQMGIRVSAAMRGNARRRGLSKVEATNSGSAYFLSPAERSTILCHKHMIEDAEFTNPRKAGRIHGIGIRDMIYNEWFLYQEILGFVLEYAERSAGGIEIWEYPSGDAQAKASIMEAAKNRMSNGRNQLFFPKPLGMEAGVYDLRIVEPGFAGIETMLGMADKYFGHRIKRLILGQTLTTEADATGMGTGVADAHRDTLSQIIRYDISNHDESVTEELVKVIQLENWPETECWKMRFVSEIESDDVQKRMEGYQAAFEMGLGIPEKDVAQCIGISLDNPNEKLLKKMQDPGMGAGMSLPQHFQFQSGGGSGGAGGGAHAADLNAAMKGADHAAGMKEDHDKAKGEVIEKMTAGKGEGTPVSGPDKYSREWTEEDEKKHPRNPAGSGEGGGRFTSSSGAGQSVDEDDDRLSDEELEDEDEDEDSKDSDSNEPDEDEQARKDYAASLPTHVNAVPRIQSTHKTSVGEYRVYLKSWQEDGEAQHEASILKDGKTDSEFWGETPEDALADANEAMGEILKDAEKFGQVVKSGQDRSFNWSVFHDGKGGFGYRILDGQGKETWTDEGFNSVDDAEKDAADTLEQETEPLQLASSSFPAVKAGKLRLDKTWMDDNTIGEYLPDDVDDEDVEQLASAVVDQMIKESGGDLINYSDLEKLKGKYESLGEKMLDKNRGNEDSTIDGLDLEDWSNEKAVDHALQEIRPALMEAVKSAIPGILDERATESEDEDSENEDSDLSDDKKRKQIDDYLESVKGHNVKRRQFAEKIARVMDLDMDEAERIVKEKFGTENYQRRSHRLLEAAAAETDLNPSQAQIEAGNYSKGIYRWNGMEIAIENPKGSVRRGVSSSGKEWERVVACHYGYFRRTMGADGDQLDVYIGNHPDSEFVLVIKQVDQDDHGKFDEFKVVVGCLNRKEAKKLYLANYPKVWKCGPAAPMTVELFKKWVESGGPERAKSLVKVERYSREFVETDDTDEKATLIAELLQHFYGDSASEMLDDDQIEMDEYQRNEDVDFYSWVRRWNESDYVRKPKGSAGGGQFAKKGSAESSAKIHEAIESELATGERSADSAKRLVDHLSQLTVKELNDLKKKYGVSASGVKAELVDKIAKRLDSGRRADKSLNPDNYTQNKIDEGKKKDDIVPAGSAQGEAGESGSGSGEKKQEKTMIIDRAEGNGNYRRYEFDGAKIVGAWPLNNMKGRKIDESKVVRPSELKGEVRKAWLAAMKNFDGQSFNWEATPEEVAAAPKSVKIEVRQASSVGGYAKPFVAKIVGYDSTYRLDRRFEDPAEKQHGGQWLYQITENGIYHVCDRNSKGAKREHFLKIENGVESSITREQVEALFPVPESVESAPVDPATSVRKDYDNTNPIHRAQAAAHLAADHCKATGIDKDKDPLYLRSVLTFWNLIQQQALADDNTRASFEAAEQQIKFGREWKELKGQEWTEADSITLEQLTAIYNN